MASLYVKSSEAANLAAELAEHLQTTKTAVVVDALRRRKAELEAQKPRLSTRERLERFWREHPLPPPTGLEADKAFYDDLSGNL